LNWSSPVTRPKINNLASNNKQNNVVLNKQM
jgi:hypothetical protein